MGLFSSHGSQERWRLAPLGFQEDHLRQLFTILRENHLIIIAKRCVFGKSIVSFLGHTVSSASISPLPSHVSAVSSFPLPTDKLGVQRFLGMINFYRKFLPNLARIVKSSTNSYSSIKILSCSHRYCWSFTSFRRIYSSLNHD